MLTHALSFRATRPIIVLVSIVLTTAPASATVYRMLTGDYTTISPDWSAYENGWSFDTVVSGNPGPPTISTQHVTGSHSIQIEVPTDNSGNKERFEYVIARATDPNGLHFDNARYYGFSFKLGSPATAFNSSDLFWQAWQGFPWGPPASLKLTADSSPPFTVGLYVRNLSTGPDSAQPDLKLWSSAMIQPDTWYNVVIYLSPRYTNDSGRIQLWINGTNFVNATTNIGYDPNQTYSFNGTNYGVLNGLDLKNGMYQPEPNNGHTMYFDQLIFADTFAEAAGLLPPANTPPVATPASATILRNTSMLFDLATLTQDSLTVATQCVYTISTTNGTATLLADGHMARFTPATNFLGTATCSFSVTDQGEDPRELLHYDLQPSDNFSNGFVTDSSGHFRDGNLLAVGAGTFGYSSNSPLPSGISGSLQLAKSGTANAVRLSRYISNPAEFNFSDSSWTFSGWFQRIASNAHDFLFYIGSGDGFGGDGDELQLYCPGGSPALTVQHYNAGNALDLSASSAATAAAGQWHHAALVFQRTNNHAGLLSAYLDGSQFTATNVAWSLPQQLPLVFGGHNKTNANVNRWFNGWLADLAIFTNALSTADITSLAARTVSQFGGLTASNITTITITNYARPRLSNPILTNDTWRLAVNGDVGAYYTVQSSSNLTSWVTLLVTNLSVMPFTYVDPATGVARSAFYRLLIAP